MASKITIPAALAAKHGAASTKILESVAKALWENEPHRLLKHGGHSVIWEEQPRSLQRDFYKRARVSIVTYLRGAEQAFD